MALGITLEELVASVRGQQNMIVSSIKQKNYLLLRFLLGRGLSPEILSSRLGIRREETPIQYAVNRGDRTALHRMLEGGSAGKISRQQLLDIHQFAAKKRVTRCVELINRYINRYINS